MAHSYAIALSVGLAALAPAAAGAQVPQIHHVTGDAAGDWFGYAVAPVGDIDLDGIPDFLVGAHQNQNFGHSPDPGYVRVFSGADGSVLFTIHGDGTFWTDGPDDHFGAAVDGLGDIDGDGYPDFIVGAYKDDNNGQNSGMVRVFSGKDGSILHQIDGENPGDRLGFAVSGCPDIDGDGVPDYMVGAYKDDHSFFNSGSVYVYSGADHSLIHRFDGASVGAIFGWSCRPAGDVNGDGVVDIVVGAPSDDLDGASVGSAWVYSGADGSLLHTWYGDTHGDYFGHAVDGAGDVNGDGHADVLVSALQSFGIAGTTGPGYVRVLSGADGSVLREFQGDEHADQFGFSLRGVGDVTGDGHADFLIGAPQGIDLLTTSGKPGFARLYSGRDGKVVYTLIGASPEDQLGVSVAVVADMDGDGFPEFLLGACEDVPGQTRPGYASVVSGAFVLTSRYCTAAPNSAGPGSLLDHSGSLSIGANDFALRASDCPPHHFGLFYYGNFATGIPFGDGNRCVGGQTYRLAVAGTGPSGAASVEVDLSNPPLPTGRIYPGSTWHFQFWYRDIPAMQSGFNFTDAISATFLH